MSGRRRSCKHIERHTRNVLPDCVLPPFFHVFYNENDQAEHTQLDCVSAAVLFSLRFSVIRVVTADVVISAARA